MNGLPFSNPFSTSRSMPVLLSLYILTFFALNNSFSAAAAVKITTDGAAVSIIALGSDASYEDEYAAGQLAKYLEKISGAAVPVIKKKNTPEPGKTTIFVGNNSYLQQQGIYVGADNEDAFRTKTVGDDILVLMGNGTRGTVFSVFAFLEELGCRWFMPYDLGEVVPSQPSIEISPLDKLEVPDFEIRFNAADGDLPGRSLEQRKSYYKWMLQNRFNRGFGVGYARYNVSNGPTGHAYSSIIPTSEYFTEHPEFFPLIDGVRQSEGQRCVSNPRLMEETLAHIDAHFSNNANDVIFSVSPNDGKRWCEDEFCEAWDGVDKYSQGRTEIYRNYSGRVFKFADLVARQMAQSHPDKYTTVYAYSDYSEPPSGFDPPANLIIQICHNKSACSAHPIGAGCEVNDWFVNNVVNAWSALTPNLWYHEYTYKWKFCELPWPMWNNLAADVKYLHAKGVWGFFARNGKVNWGSNGLYYYILSKLLWDVNADVDAIIADYCDKFYQNAAQPMKNYFNFMADLFKEPGYHLKNLASMKFVEQAVDIYTPQVLQQAGVFLDEALAATTDPTVRQRIRIVEFTHRYAELMVEFVSANMQRKNTKNRNPEDIQRTRETGNRVLDFIQANYVPWSITLKTSIYGGQYTVQRILAELPQIHAPNNLRIITE